MKKYLLIAFALISVLGACTKDDTIIYEDNIASKIYFIDAATSQVKIVKAEDLDENGEIMLPIYASGNNSGKILGSVKIDEDAIELYNIETKSECKLLPEKYFSLKNTTFTLSTTNYRTFLNVMLDVAAFKNDNLSGDEYVLPLTIVASKPQETDIKTKSLIIKIQ